MISQASNMMKRFIVIVFFVLTVSACLPFHTNQSFRYLEPQDMAPSWSPDSTQVVFVCYRRQRIETEFGDHYQGPYDGIEGYKLREICLSDVDGGNRHQLTDNLVADYDPSWSPNGMHIAFVSTSEDDAGSNIFVMQRDGTNLIRLTLAAAEYRKPRWSPDGSTIAFARDNTGEGLYVVEIDNNQTTRLVEGLVLDFAWSPDGESIVFYQHLASSQEILMVDIETGSILQLTNNQLRDFEPVWSPDGYHIAFSSERENGIQVYIMDIQTREVVRISDISESSSWGSWSPDGRFFSYVSGRTPNQQLHILNLESGILTSTDFRTHNRPIWSPNSQFLLYERTEDWNDDGFRETKLWALQVEDGAELSISEGADQ